ncbi:hypothetical protein D1867_02995 [Acidianus infernus]|uniref:DUF5678 domain-containing protein n=2 Tax=Acidianus infernus TaxID=12915 RepID=A0A6A9QG95_ACIIN|nr:hypothetical protein [Acidianus infernus]
MLIINDSRFVGKYVAIDSNDRIIGYADTREELVKNLEQKGYKIHEYSILYIPSQFKLHIEYSKVCDEELPLMNLKINCNSNSFRAIATFGNTNLINKEIAEFCGIYEEGEIEVEIGIIKKKIKVKVADLNKVDLPIVPGLILSPTNFIVCFYDNYFEISD